MLARERLWPPARAPRPAPAEATANAPPPRTDFFVTEGKPVYSPADTHLLALAGRVDVPNRYPSSVLITVDVAQDIQAFCSGVVLAPRLVLTAGHCVCPRRRVHPKPGELQAATLIDGAGCAQTAKVTAVEYKPRAAVGNDLNANRDDELGSVRVHPELRVMLDAKDQVISSSADLGLIVLDKPLGPPFHPLPLASSEVRPGESLVIVGTGYDELYRAYDQERRASLNRVSSPPSEVGGRVRIEQPGGHPYRGDSGGPCLRESASGPELVGISARALGEGKAVTSTYEYRDWLHAEMQRAAALPQGPLTR